MKIAQVSPLYESVPPKTYGGTERVVSYLTEELVERGHEVTLFASADSVTNARLISPCTNSLRLSNNYKNEIIYHTIQLQMVQDHLGEFDIIHYHTDFFHYPLSKLNKSTQLTTLHGRLDNPDLQCLYDTFSDMPLVSISESQQKPLPQANWIKTIYHGLPKHLYKFQEKKGDYLAFLGRICPEKGIEESIQLASQTGIPLKIAAKIDEADTNYFEYKIKPLLNNPLVEYIGEIGENEKNAFLGNAYCTLFLISWPEPFGLVMVESLASGTPVLAFNNGSVPEILKDGISGFVVQNLQEAAQKIPFISNINPFECRRQFENNFSVQRMTSDYLDTYQNIIDHKKHKSKSSFIISNGQNNNLRVV